MTREDFENAGAALARRVLLLRRPMTAELLELMAPNLRRGFERELERLGACAFDAHVWEPDRVSHSSPKALLAIRGIRTEIETCQRCRLWRDKGDR